uniref:CCHC-type domain-containing protein n=1 Tax=Solanum lycopersicum TaxID=4081 RepID=A0A3Q7EXF3_SOLLC
MDAYFGKHIDMHNEASKIRTTAMYLTDTAMLWWRQKKADMERGACQIDDWEQFKSELKRQFYPQNVVHEALAESLNDFRGDAAKGRDNRSKTIPPKSTTATGAGADQIPAGAKNYEDRKRGAPQREGCYICGETTHAARYCPSLRKLSSMVAAKKQQEKAAAQAGSSAGEKHGQSTGSDKGKNVVVRMFNHMALIIHNSNAALAAKLASVRPRESLFVDAKLNGKDVRIMELGLYYVASRTKLKTINATPTTVHGFAPKVPIELGDWTGQTDFTIAPMDVFDMILGLDFWYEVNVFISPRHNQLHISDTDGSCVVPLIRIIKVFKRGEPTFLATLIEDVESCTKAVPLPPCITQVLSNNKDTACVTRYGAFDWLVMPFGLTNAPATFCTLMNRLFHSYLDQFVVIYLDDIVVYSNNIEDHVEHLCKVFKILRDNELYVKREKCSFAQPTVHFLGHTVSHGEIRMDSDKIDAIKNWEAPTKNWSEACQAAFERLKAAVMEEPVLALPDFSKAFKVHTDASDFTIGWIDGLTRTC